MATVARRDATTATTTDASTYASASFTPTAGELLVVLANIPNSVLAAPTCTASANGLTFTRVKRILTNTSTHMLVAFVSDQLVPGSPAAMTVTVDVTGDAGTGALLAVLGVGGMTKTGATAVLNASGADNNHPTGGVNPTITVPATTAGNPLIGCVGNNTGGGATTAPPTGWTEVYDQGIATPTRGFEIAVLAAGAAGATSVTWTATSTIGGVIVLELDASGGGTQYDAGTVTHAAVSTHVDSPVKALDAAAVTYPGVSALVGAAGSRQLAAVTVPGTSGGADGPSSRLAAAVAVPAASTAVFAALSRQGAAVTVPGTSAYAVAALSRQGAAVAVAATSAMIVAASSAMPAAPQATVATSAFVPGTTSKQAAVPQSTDAVSGMAAVAGSRLAAGSVAAASSDGSSSVQLLAGAQVTHQAVSSAAFDAGAQLGAQVTHAAQSGCVMAAGLIDNGGPASSVTAAESGASVEAGLIANAAVTVQAVSGASVGVNSRTAAEAMFAAQSGGNDAVGALIGAQVSVAAVAEYSSDTSSVTAAGPVTYPAVSSSSIQVAGQNDAAVSIPAVSGVAIAAQVRAAAAVTTTIVSDVAVSAALRAAAQVSHAAVAGTADAVGVRGAAAVLFYAASGGQDAVQARIAAAVPFAGAAGTADAVSARLAAGLAADAVSMLLVTAELIGGGPPHAPAAPSRRVTVGADSRMAEVPHPGGAATVRRSSRIIRVRPRPKDQEVRP